MCKSGIRDTIGKGRSVNRAGFFKTILTVLFLCCSTAFAADRLVPSQYPTIQSAINAAVTGDSVIISPGTYTGSGNRDINVNHKNITIRSTDPNDPNIVAATIIDCQGTPSDNHRGFYFHFSSSVLNGLTVQNGCAFFGGAVYCADRGVLLFSNCVFTGNTASEGGAINTQPPCLTTVDNCKIINNIADLAGGGIYSYGDFLTVTNSVIANNITTEEGDDLIGGGGIYCESWGSLTITGCVISGNKTQACGGAVSAFGSVTIAASKICNNTALGCGGGIACGDLKITDSTINGNLSWGAGNMGGGIFTNGEYAWITGCTISHNSSTIAGGGILSFSRLTLISSTIVSGNKVIEPVLGLPVSGAGIDCSDGQRATITNCTVTGNMTPGYGAAVSTYHIVDGVIVTNCIVRNNRSAKNADIYARSRISISFTDLQGGKDAVYGSVPQWGPGNIDNDPCFTQTGYFDPNGTPADPNDDFWVDGDYHLRNTSPCVNTGDPNYTPEPNETDLDGNPRILYGRVDMGAFEFLNHPPVANAGPDQTLEAQSPWGSIVHLDGSNSTDADSTPGTNDDIVSFNWYEQIDPCDSNSNILLGTGQILDCNLPLGSHTIILEVTDRFGSFDSNKVTIIVQDTTPPSITCPADITLEGTCPAGAVATFAASATDLVDPQPLIIYSTPSGSMFPLGSTPVTCTAADSNGNSANCTFNVTVVDTTPPQFTLSVTPTVLWPLSKKMTEITPTWTVTDLCDPNPTVSLVNIRINEPCVGDIQTGPNGSIYLRAWRSGSTAGRIYPPFLGRIYTLTFQAVDDSGNITQSSATVTVPHDQRTSK